MNSLRSECRNLSMIVMVLLFSTVAASCASAASEQSVAETQSDESKGALQSALGLSGSRDAILSDVQNQASRIAEERVQLCMKSRGFEYVQVVQDVQEANAPSGLGLTDREFAATYGLGIVIPQREQFAGGAFSAGLVITDSQDPNDEIFNALSASEQIEWYLALWGADAGPRRFEAIQEIVDPPISCWEQVSGVDSTRVINEFVTLLVEIGDRVQSNPDVVAAERGWSDCMKEIGFEHASRLDMRIALFNQSQEAIAEAMRGSDDILAPDEIETRVAEALDPLVQRELDLAAADLECGAQLTAITDAVTGEVEEDIIAERSDLLGELSEILVLE